MAKRFKAGGGCRTNQEGATTQKRRPRPPALTEHPTFGLIGLRFYSNQKTASPDYATLGADSMAFLNSCSARYQSTSGEPVGRALKIQS